MNRVEVYSTDNCPWCERAKSLLRARGLDFEEIDILRIRQARWR